MSKNTAFAPLKRRDVEIGMICHEGFLVTTTPEKYQIVRNCLTVMAEQEGLPLDYASEIEGMKVAALFEALKTPPPDFVIQEKGSLPRVENHFLVPGYKKVGANVLKMKAMAHQVAEKLRNFQLEVEVNEESCLRPKMDSEAEFIYTVAVTSVALEVAKVSKTHPIWNGVPSIIKIMLLTGEFEAIQKVVADTPPLLEAVSELFGSYNEEVGEAIAACENFKESYDPNEPAKSIAKLQLNRPTNQVMKMLKILQEYHKS